MMQRLAGSGSATTEAPQTRRGGAPAASLAPRPREGSEPAIPIPREVDDPAAMAGATVLAALVIVLFVGVLAALVAL